jgi:hypothetical protein
MFPLLFEPPVVEGSRLSPAPVPVPRVQAVACSAGLVGRGGVVGAGIALAVVVTT